MKRLLGLDWYLPLIGAALGMMVGLGSGCSKEQAVPPSSPAAPSATSEGAGSEGAKVTEPAQAATSPSAALATAAVNEAAPAEAPAAGDSGLAPLWPAYPDAVRARIADKTTEAGYEATVTAPWGVVTVQGPAGGVGEVIARYWAAFSTADFDAVYAFAGGEMRDRLGSYDSKAGRPDFQASIESRMATNPMVSVRVESAAQTDSTHAGGLVVTTRADGSSETREMALIRGADGWRVERVRQQR